MSYQVMGKQQRAVMIVMSDHGREQKNLGRDHVIRCALSQRSVYPLRVPSRVSGCLARLTSLISNCRTFVTAIPNS
jgi:hypothetical protein